MFTAVRPAVTRLRPLRPVLILFNPRYYSTDLGARLGPRRAVVYNENGPPAEVARVVSSIEPVQLGDEDVLVQFLASPINPSDLNVIEGKYPLRPGPIHAFDASPDGPGLFVGGHEGVAQVIKTGRFVDGPSKKDKIRIKVGDWVLMRKPQTGTWANWKVVPVRDLRIVTRKKTESKITEAFAATLMVNTLTSYGLMKDITPNPELHAYILQNGANSAVGQAIIQTAKQLGFKTVNFVRDRPDYPQLKQYLMDLGADHVFTYDELLDPSFKKTFASLKATPVKKCRHAFNCIGGVTAAAMAALLDNNGHLISYGGMSKAPIPIPVGLQIFKNLTAHGYWHSGNWEMIGKKEQDNRIEKMLAWRETGRWKDPEHELLILKGDDEEATRLLRDGLRRVQEGKVGKKILIKWASPGDSK